ncbi:MAG: hypothetical protein M5U01_24755 [Ardenticatenaceae bacterium]|nr:hypothetical protein [Ardenticatenaceae bacterium]HBY97302.1 hypothetical protein [Chloroflexota bacterium]
MKIVLLANLKQNAPHHPDAPADIHDDLDSPSTIEAILASLEAGGHTATFVEADEECYARLRSLRDAGEVDLCFNIAEGHRGASREAQIPALLDLLGIRYTGSGVMTLALTLDKPMTKRLLSFHHLPTPPFQVFDYPDEPIDADLRYPLFAKPSREGTGIGVTARSIVYDERQLRAQIAEIIQRYRQPALVERFIEGREVTVGLVGNLGADHKFRFYARHPELDEPEYERAGLHLFPPLEVDFSRYPAEEAGVYTNRIKTEFAESFSYYCPAPLDPGLVAELEQLTVGVFRATGCLDVARVDFRLDASDNNTPYILEINPLPGLSPGISDLVLMAAAEGWDHAALINAIVAQAARRLGLAGQR